MRRRLDLARGGDDGLVAVIVAVFAIVMFVFGAMVVDLGLAREARRDAQSAADSAALAAAGELYDDANVMYVDRAVQAARDFAESNFGTKSSEWGSCSTTLPAGWTTSVAGTGSGTSCIAFDSATRPTKVQVVIPTKRTGVAFGGIIGYEGLDIGALAQAGLTPTTRRACALCVFNMLEVDTGDVIVTGGGDVAAGDGEVQQTNGSLQATDGGQITFQNTPNPASGSVYSPQPTIDGVAVGDPYDGVALPTSFGTPYSADSVTCGQGGVKKLSPGVYGDITVKNDTCTFEDGLFVITGTLSMAANPNTELVGGATTLYFTCGTRTSPSTCSAPGEAGGNLDFQGNGTFRIDSWDTPNFSVLYHPWNTSPVTLAGNASATYLGGSLYAKSSTLTISGNGAITIANRMVVDSLDFNGAQTQLSVNAAGLSGVPGPPELTLIK